MQIPSEILDLLNPSVRQALSELCGNAEEIRLRTGCRPAVFRQGKQICLSQCGLIRPEELQRLVEAACRHSCYAMQDCIRCGYIPLAGGHRIGLCGLGAVRDGQIYSLRDFSSVCIRIAHDIRPNTIPSISGSTILLGPPGCGKTTLLRACIRTLSSRCQRVGVADERGEIAAYYAGLAQFDLGDHTDTLTGIPKAEAMLMLLRTMNPQWIAADEITREQDALAVEQCAYCGIRLLVTAHASSREELDLRPVYRRLMQLGIFEKLIVMRPDQSFTEETLRYA